MDKAIAKYAKNTALNKSHSRANIKSKDVVKFVEPWAYGPLGEVSTSSEDNKCDISLFKPWLAEGYPDYNLYIAIEGEEESEEPIKSFKKKPTISELEQFLSEYFGKKVILPPENDAYKKLGSDIDTEWNPTVDEAMSICKEIINSLQKADRGATIYKDHFEIDGNTAYGDIRDWGEWGTSDEWEDDYDQMELHEESYDMLDNIMRGFQNKYPDYKIAYYTGEKRYIYIDVTPKKLSESLDEIEEETANYKRKRLASPKSCKANSFRTKQVNAKGDKVILCKDKKSNKLKAQSVLTAKNEDRFFKKELTPLPKKETEFKIGDVVTLDNNQTGEIIQAQLMAMSDTPVYKIKTKDGKNVWRYQEEIKQAVSEMDMGDLGTDPIGKMGVVKAKGLARNKKFKRKSK